MPGKQNKKGKNEMNTEANPNPMGGTGMPSMMGNPAVVTEIDDMREFTRMNPDMEDVADYSSKYQANPDMDKESKEYVQSRNYNTGGSVCEGGGKAIRGMNFTGVK